MSVVPAASMQPPAGTAPAASRAQPVVRVLHPGPPPDGAGGPGEAPPLPPAGDARIAAWLAALCRQIPNHEQAVALIDAAAGPQVLHWPATAGPDPALDALARRARAAGATQIDAAAAGTTRIACPLRLAGQVCGAVAVRVAGLARSQHGVVAQLLDWGSTWLDLVLAAPAAAPDAAPVERALAAVLADVAGAFEHPRFDGAALAVASSAAHHLGFTRVSIGVHRHGTVTLAAVSDTPDLAPRTAFAGALRAAMKEAAAHGTALRVDADSAAADLAAHRALAAEGGAHAVLSVPLRYRGEVCAVMVCERAEPIADPLPGACDALAGVLGPALELARRQQPRAWQRLPRGLRGTTLMLALLAGAAALGALPIDYRVTAPARVEGSVQRAVVAPFDGYVDSASARAGDRVADGAVLATLQESTLRLERATAAGERDELAKQYRRALAGRDRAEALVLEARMAQAQARLDLLDAQLVRTRIVAPFAGIVISGDLSRALGSPVQRGQVLFELAPLDGHRIVLQADERDVAELSPGMRGQLALAALPDESFALTVERVSGAARTETGRSVFLVEARLDDAAPALRPGMEGVAKVAVERRALAWVVTHPLVEWLALQLWSLRP